MRKDLCAVRTEKNKTLQYNDELNCLNWLVEQIDVMHSFIHDFYYFKCFFLWVPTRSHSLLLMDRPGPCDADGDVRILL